MEMLLSIEEEDDDTGDRRRSRGEGSGIRVSSSSSPAFSPRFSFERVASRAELDAVRGGGGRGDF